MSAILGAGILMAIKRNPWLLVAGFIGMIIAVGKIGCTAHSNYGCRRSPEVNTDTKQPGRRVLFRNCCDRRSARVVFSFA